MKLKLKYLLFGFVMASSYFKAQDAQFTQFYNNSNYLNSSFTGLTDLHRFSAGYRNQWPGIKKTFSTYYVSYDRNIKAYNSGVGGFVMQDRIGSGGLVNTMGVMNYAYSIKTGFSSQIRPSVSLGFGQKRIDHSKLTFNDQFITGSSVSEDVNVSNTKTYIDLGAGALFNSEKFWGGFMFKHINKPNVNVLGGNEYLPVLVTAHAGYKVIIKANDTNSTKPTQALNFVANYRHQKMNDQIDLGIIYNHKALIGGILYRGNPPKYLKDGYLGNDALAILLGLDLTGKNLQINYSYDFTISGLNNSYSTGAHEIIFSFEIPDTKPKVISYKKKKAKVKRKF